MQLTTAPYNRLVPYEQPERSGGFRASFEDDEVQTRIQQGLDKTELNTLCYWYAPQVVRGAYEFADDEQRHFFGADYRGIALVESVERELKRKNPNIKHFIWGV